MRYDDTGLAGRETRNGAATSDTGSHQTTVDTTSTSGTDCTWRLTSSQSVSFWEVHEFVASMLARVGSWPMAGTPAWCALPADHPAKLAALFDAAQHWALRLETSQEAGCQASHDISGAADWGAVGRRIQGENEWYMSHPWMRRVV